MSEPNTVEHVVHTQQAIDDLRAHNVTSPEDLAYLDEEERKVDEARANIGKSTLTLVQTPNGFETKADIDRWREEGDNPTEGAYKGNRR